MRWILVGSVLILWFLLLVNSPHSFSPVQRGKMLFMAVGILAFAFSLLSGVFLTADCLSHEKREGTLGLLFLTNLRGYDVVLGKLIATSIHAFYGLLAILPLLALPLLIGGVSAAQFWRVTLSLITTMLVSLSLGMIVSATTRDTRASVGVTLLVLILLAAFPPAFWALVKSFRMAWSLDPLLYLSPGYLYAQAHDAYIGRARRVSNFNVSLTVLLSLAALFLAGASAWLRRSWQDKGEAAATGRQRSGRARWRFVSRPGHDANPCFWLCYRDRRPQQSATFIIGTLFVLFLCFAPGCFSSSMRMKEPSFTVLMLTAFGMHFLLKVFVALEASRRLNEDRRSGALELLLVTPMSLRQIISGQTIALQKMFIVPVAIVVMVNLFMLWLAAVPDPMRMRGEAQVMMCEAYFGGLVMLFLDTWALGRVGMLMGYRKRRHHWAIFATLFRIILLPWLAVFFFMLTIASGGGFSSEAFIVLILFYFIFAALFDTALVSWATQALLAELREAPGMWLSPLIAGINPAPPATATAPP